MFIHLHVHSNYSLCEGASSIEALCAAAKALGMPALALTDTNNLYGAVWFRDIARAYDLRPIYGAELCTGGARAVLLVKDRGGYSRLCSLITRRHLDDDFSLTDTLASDRTGLVVLSDVPELLRRVREATGPEDLYVEVQPGPQRLAGLRLARQLGLPAVATNGVRFVAPADHALHRLLRAIDLNTTLERLPAGEMAPPGAWLKSGAEMAAAFPDAPNALRHTEEIAERCTFELDFGGPVFPTFDGLDDREAVEALRRLTYEGARWRYGEITDRVRDRLEYELDLISRKNFASYFLIVWDIVRRSQRTCGRGSAAASAVSYCLGITHVDPIRYDLFFERFLNEERKDFPDIDVDFAWDERDEVFDYVFNKYGRHRAAMVCNHVTFQPRMAIREVAKVYGLTDAEIGEVTRRYSWLTDNRDLFGTATHDPAFRGLTFPKPWPAIFQQAQRIMGYPRHLSVHSGGVVIVPDALDRYVPRQRAAKGVEIIQWEKDATEEMGLVKIDLLGNRSLAVVRDGLAAVKRNTGREIDYARWQPQDDPATRRLIATGETFGVFYVESPAMRLLQKKARTGDFEHLVIHSSIIRPAANRFIQEYLRRLHGQPYEPLHPALGDILRETYGIMVYQEDVSRAAMALAGFNAAEADDLRKVLSKKHRHHRLEDYRQKFFAGCARHGVGRQTVEQIWEMILSFSGYSFCKPHSASYALLSYKAAYLRAHYPAEFMAAVISNQGGYYSTLAYLSECRRMGLRILGPDINESDDVYVGKGDCIRVGLMQIKGLRQESIAAILQERRRGGPYRSYSEFLDRMCIDPEDVRRLIRAGVFDALEPQRPRPELLWQWYAWNDRRQRAGRHGGASFFDSGALQVPAVRDYGWRTKIQLEIESFGFPISVHPLTLYRDRTDRIPHIDGRDLERYVGRAVTLIGWPVTRKGAVTRQDEAMEFVSFEDETAIYECTLFPREYRRYCHLLTSGRPYVIKGRVEEEFSGITVTVQEVRLLG